MFYGSLRLCMPSKYIMVFVMTGASKSSLCRAYHVHARQHGSILHTSSYEMGLNITVPNADELHAVSRYLLPGSLSCPFAAIAEAL